MNNMKNLGISLLISILTLLLLTLLLTTCSYFNIMGGNFVKFLKISIPIISLFAGGFYLGKMALKRGWLEGIKLGGAMTVLLLLFNYLALRYHFKVDYLLYVVILFVSSILGSMIGINFKKEKECS